MNGLTTPNRMRLIATALAMCIVYQLGACRCGCFEHNYWLQALGAVDTHDHTANLGSEPSVAIGDNEHACTGKLHTVYFNSSNRCDGPFVHSVEFHLLKSALIRVSEIPPGTFQPYRGPPDKLVRPLRQATLQVFQL